jgi:transposase
MMGWMAPLRHLSAKLLVIESAATGSHPWARLRQLDWTWRSMFFRCTGSEQLEAAVAAIEKQLTAWHKSNPVSQRLATIPGIGPIIATAIAATATEPSGFRSGREFAAWLGLVPRQNSTGGKVRLGGISKRGNRYLRRLLINGASANLLRSKATNADPWVIGLRRRRPSLVVAVALANKTARMAWAVMQRKENYQRMAVAA